MSCISFLHCLALEPWLVQLVAEPVGLNTEVNNDYVQSNDLVDTLVGVHVEPAELGHLDQVLGNCLSNEVVDRSVVQESEDVGGKDEEQVRAQDGDQEFLVEPFQEAQTGQEHDRDLDYVPAVSTG